MNEVTESVVVPSEASDDEVRAAALEWVNMTRTEYGLEALSDLPQGHRGVSQACALAEALKGVGDASAPVLLQPGPRYVGPADVSDLKYNFAREGRTQARPVPELVGQFVQRFDAGAFPDLVDG